MAKTKIKYYAVLNGRRPGIYTAWNGEDEAQAQVVGYPNARYQSFDSFEDAENWLRDPDKPVIVAKEKSPRSGSGENNAERKAGKTSEIEDMEIRRPDDLPEDTVVIYSDGGCLRNPGPGGYGVVLLYKGKQKELCGAFQKTTNNRMELMGCIEGLKALKFPCNVVILTDSQYVVNGITKGWAIRWKKKGWMRNEMEPAENYDLWNQLLELCKVHKVEFRWVRGHAGNPGNERCDVLANGMASGKDILARDVAYEMGKTTIV